MPMLHSPHTPVTTYWASPKSVLPCSWGNSVLRRHLSSLGLRFPACLASRVSHRLVLIKGRWAEAVCHFLVRSSWDFSMSLPLSASKGLQGPRALGCPRQRKPRSLNHQMEESCWPRGTNWVGLPGEVKPWKFGEVVVMASNVTLKDACFPNRFPALAHPSFFPFQTSQTFIDDIHDILITHVVNSVPDRTNICSSSTMCEEQDWASFFEIVLAAPSPPSPAAGLKPCSLTLGSSPSSLLVLGFSKDHAVLTAEDNVTHPRNRHLSYRCLRKLTLATGLNK